MADLRRAEKLASAKKRLKQYQQKSRDGQSESGRSTPSKKKLEDEDGLGKTLQSENGGSTYSLSQSENLSSNISGAESPVLTSENNIDNLCQIFNGNSQPDIVNVSNVFNELSKIPENLFKTPSPHSYFTESPTVSQYFSAPASDFFDNFSSGNNEPGRQDSQASQSAQEVEQVPNAMLNVAAYHHSLHVNASTPDGPLFHDTPNYSFPDASVSPIKQMKSDVSEDALTNELEVKFNNTCARNAELEQHLTEQKTQIIQLQSHLEDMKKKADDETSALKHHVQAIEILVSEKTELQNALDKRQEQIQCVKGEVEELQGRLRASRHRVSDLERELSSTKSQLQALDTSYRELSAQQASLLQESDSLKKRMGDLELEVSDLQSKLESRDQTLNTLKTEMDEKTSQLSLAQVRIQQLGGGPGNDGAIEEELHHKNEELLKSVSSLKTQLEGEQSTKEESMKEYQRYVNRLHTEVQELKTAHEVSVEQCRQLAVREQQLVQQVSELERQLNRAPQPVEDPALRTLRDQLRLAEDSCQSLQTQLQQKSSEVDCLREGLQERALRIQELEVTVDRLETECPDSANLQAAIESDKVAASRAVAQNNNLKKQLEELQEALVKLSNSKLELTQQLQHEQHLSRDLTEKLDKIQLVKETRSVEVEQAQQTEQPVLRECEVQTTNSQPVVSPEAMNKLEEKFRKTMGELADLSDEKQRLEHLVQQLQSETETIGEYITLYQIQRGMLRQRAQEKDEQVAKLAQDKEALRNKLSQLNCLVQRLVGSGHVNGYESEATAEDKQESDPAESTNPQTTTDVETAEKIRSLLTEIGSNNLVTSTGDNTNINFHPCPWCSGRLITV